MGFFSRSPCFRGTCAFKHRRLVLRSVLLHVFLPHAVWAGEVCPSIRRAAIFLYRFFLKTCLLHCRGVALLSSMSCCQSRGRRSVEHMMCHIACVIGVFMISLMLKRFLDTRETH